MLNETRRNATRKRSLSIVYTASYQEQSSKVINMSSRSQRLKHGSSLSVCLHVCLSVCLSVCPSVCLSLSQFSSLSTAQTIHFFIVNVLDAFRYLGLVCHNVYSLPCSRSGQGGLESCCAISVAGGSTKHSAGTRPASHVGLSV